MMPMMVDLNMDVTFEQLTTYDDMVTRHIYLSNFCCRFTNKKEQHEYLQDFTVQSLEVWVFGCQ